MQKLLKAVVTSLMVMSFMAPAGCDQPRAKFEKVHLGMTRAEAVKILGEPQEKETMAQGELLRWRLGDQTLVLHITRNQVTGKQLADSEKQKS